jgi:hypothetical protein
MTCTVPGCQAEDMMTVMGDDQVFGSFCGLPHLIEWATGTELVRENISDGFVNSWPLCKPDCQLQVVRPGKVQCECEDEADRYGHGYRGPND